MALEQVLLYMVQEVLELVALVQEELEACQGGLDLVGVLDMDPVAKHLEQESLLRQVMVLLWVELVMGQVKYSNTVYIINITTNM